MKKAARDTLTKAGIFLLLIAFLFLITWFLYLKFSNSGQDAVEKTKVDAPDGIILEIRPFQKEVKIGESLAAEVVLQNVPQDITSFALRIICSWNEKVVVLDTSQEGRVLLTSEQLESQGWTFPVRQVKAFENSWQVDLAGINLSGEKTREKTLVLSQIEFQVKAPSSSLNCRFDPSLTKVLTRSAQNVPLDLGGASYVISN